MQRAKEKGPLPLGRSNLMAMDFFPLWETMNF